MNWQSLISKEKRNPTEYPLTIYHKILLKNYHILKKLSKPLKYVERNLKIMRSIKNYFLWMKKLKN